MLEESCNLHLNSIYTRSYHWNFNSAKCFGEYSDLICGVNMPLLIQIKSVDQITLSSPSSLNSAVKEISLGIPKQLLAQQYFLLIRCVLSHYNLFHSIIMLQRLSIFLCMLQWSAPGLLVGRLWSPRPQAARPVHQWQLLGETTSEPGPFGGPNNNMNASTDRQEVQLDRPVLRKALFSEQASFGKKSETNWTITYPI